jgi:hypothetical protein
VGYRRPMIFMRCLAARRLVSICLLCIARSVAQRTLALEHEPTVVPGRGKQSRSLLSRDIHYGSTWIGQEPDFPRVTSAMRHAVASVADTGSGGDSTHRSASAWQITITCRFLTRRPNSRFQVGSGPSPSNLLNARRDCQLAPKDKRRGQTLVLPT